MNRIFKVIWSETKHAYCVVSEIAHTHRRTSTRRTKAASLAAVFLVSVAGSAYAALTPDQQAVYDAVIQQLAQTSGKATLGKVKVDNDKETLSLGYVQWDGKHGNLYLGTTAAGNEVGTSQTQYTHGISGANIAWGSGNVAGSALEAETEEATVDGKKTNIITGYKRTRQADGFMIPLWNINSSGAARSYSTAIGFLNAAYGVGAFSVGQYSAAGADSAFAGGYDAIASAKQAFAFGKEVKAMGENSVAMGEKSEAWANNSFAVGNTAKAQDVGAIAMGNNATASGKSSFAAGVKSKATAYSTVALGDNAEAGGIYSVAMGHKAKATEENSSAVGAWAKATGEYSSALGASSKALGFLSTAVGGGKVKEDGDRGLSMGYGAQTTVADGVSVGSDSVASRSGNVYGYNVLGGNAYDTESIGAAYGQGKKEEIEGYDRSLVEKQPQLEAAEVAYNKAKQDLDDMFHGRSGALEFTSANQEKLEAEIARTKKVYENLQKEFDEIKAKRNKLTGAYLSSSAAVSVGNEVTGMTRQITGVAAGTKDTDAVNVAQLKALNKKVDGKKDIHFFSSNGLDSCVNYDNQGARAGYTTAIGPDAMATEENSQAFGYRAKAIGHSSIVFGVESTASGARDIAIGYGTHAVGSDNTNTSWNDTIAIGWNALSRGGSFASGSGAVAGGSGSVALGSGAYVGTKWLDDETKKAQNVNKWVLTRSFLDNGLRDELKAKFPEKFAEWERRAKNMPDAMGSDYLEQKLRTLAMEQLPQMTSPSMKNKMKDMGSSIAIGRGAKVYSAFAIAIGSEAKVGENLDDAIALGNQSLATRNAGGFGYDPTSDAKTWTAFKKAHPEVGVGAAREQEITRELNNIKVEMNQMGNEYAAWIDKEQHYENYKEERKAYAEAHGNTLDGNNEWVEWVVHVRNEQQKLRNKGQVLYDKFSVLQKELNSGKGAWVGGKAALAIGNEEAGVTRQITGVAAGTEDTDAVNVAQLKVLNTKVDTLSANSGVHYFSVNSSETGEGSNYKNDGAKGVHAVAIGAYATADIAGGVALGRDSTAKREGGLFGYNPKNGAAFVDGTAVAEYLGKTTEYDALQTEMTAKKKAVEEAKKALKENAADTTKKENLNKAYQALEAVQQKENLLLGAYRSASGYGAFSVGNEEKGITRQITGVAAGTKDTDAVNVAQLKVLNTKVDKVAANSTAYTVETKENDDNTTTVTIKSNKAGDKGTTVTVATKDIHITSGTYDKNTKKLTFTTNTNTTFDVDMNDVINAAAEGSVHYLSVKSSETGEGSNYKNDGAKAKGSIVLGVRSSSEGINGVVVGNDNKLTGTKNDQNNSVVIGTGLNVDGVHNIVVGTNYENYDQKETKVKGAHNTVIGNGNLVGYTAVQDPHDATKWKYTEVSTSGSDVNVVVGSCNTANGSSVAVGTSLEVENLGRAFGSGNKVIGSDNGGGQWGLALGSNNTVKGEMAVSVGTGTNASGDYTVSIGSEAKTNASQSIAMGYKAETVNGWSAAIGSGAKTEGTASTAVGGFNVKATVDYGAAFGSFSVAQREKGVSGYLANGQAGLAWKSNLGAFSVGDDVKGYSRQITGVAAGTEDTDAVNVAQLKALNTKVDKVAANSTAYTVETKENNDNTTTVTIKSNKAGDKGTTVTVATKDIHITSGTYDKTTKKLTFITNTNTTFDVDMNDVINAAAEGSVHYLSVNSSEQGAGSNYKNDGAKAKDSIVLGVRSSSEGINGVVVGNDNKLTGIKNNQNNSVVMGTGLNVDGVHNIVVGTNYENGDQKETKVKGEHNTVIGNGNLVGYTAVQDPHDATKWKYTEVSTSGSDRNVVVGSCNTANGSSVAVGTSLEVEDLGRAFGSGNKIIGSNNGGGQFGLALGSNNTVKGEHAVSVGTGTNASGDYTVSIGSEAKTNASQSIAMGYQAETVKGWSAAIGSGAKTEGTASTAVGGFNASATVDYGAAFGSRSVAQREKGVSGYLANGQSTMVWKSNLGAFSVGDDVKGFSRQITGVAAGTKDTDAVNVAQLKAIEKKIGTGGTNGKDGKSAYDIWLETQTDKTKTKQDFLDSLKGKDGKDGTDADIDIKGDTGSGVSVTSNTESGKKTYTIGLSTKIKAGEVTIDGTKDKENIAVGDVKINGEKGKGTITGLTNKTWDPQHIESGRAATEDQLQAVTQGMTEISGDITHVGAHSAALAALHPLDFNADEKLDIAAGVGNYNGANAVAVGAYYRPNERTMFSIGGSFGSGKNMVNGGVSLKVGSGSVRSMSKAVPAQQLAAQQREIREQRAQIQVLQQRDKDKEAQIQALWQELRQLKNRK